MTKQQKEKKALTARTRAHKLAKAKEASERLLGVLAETKPAALVEAASAER